jgi:glutaredoxin-dependent peroxiredoxin
VVLRIGQRAPDFALPDTERKVRKLSEMTEGGPVVVAFFPFAFSGVCDKEMCAFRDDFGRLSEMGARFVGISVDSLYALKVFGQTYGLNFPLLSDFNKKVIKAYEVFHDPWVANGYRGVAKRAVFVLDRKGILRYRWVADSPGDEPPYAEVMDAVSKLR